MDELTVVLTVFGVSLAGLVLVPVELRRRRQRRDERVLADNAAQGLDAPASIHPVIDTDRCIGSLSCLKACPEGDILGIVAGAARLVHAGNCMGHGRCAAACPVNAITLVSGTAVRGVDLPEVDGRYESSRRGVHLAGELAGIGRLRNAVEQGVQCAGFLAEALSGQPAAQGGSADVVVIGAGPSGVGCAVTLRRHGRSVRLLDRSGNGQVPDGGASQGLALSGPLALPGAGTLRGRRVFPGELQAWLGRAVASAGVPVEARTVTGLTGLDGAFTVVTDAGPISARKVVVATGLGSPAERRDPAGRPALSPFLASLGIQPRRGAAGPGGRTAAPRSAAVSVPTAEERERRRWRRVLLVAGTLGVGAMTLLWWKGRGYYPLAAASRFSSSSHSQLRPAGSLGLTIGIAAAAVMLTNFLYALRKRWSVLDGLGPLGSWLDLHVFVGVMSPLVIAFHAAFQSNNLLASGTYSALAVVVSTGLVGRYFYGLVPREAGTSLELADVLGQVERLKGRLQPALSAAGPTPLERLLAEALGERRRGPFLSRLLRSLPDEVAFRLRLAAALRQLPAGDRAATRDGLLRLHRLRVQASLFHGLRRLMRAWRSLHVALAILLVMALVTHVGVAVYLGYGPRWR